MTVLLSSFLSRKRVRVPGIDVVHSQKKVCRRFFPQLESERRDDGRNGRMATSDPTFPLAPAELKAWLRFSTVKGGLGTGVASKDVIATNSSELMFEIHDRVVILFVFSDGQHYLGECEGVVGRLRKDAVRLEARLKQLVLTPRRSPRLSEPAPEGEYLRLERSYMPLTTDKHASHRASTARSKYSSIFAISQLDRYLFIVPRHRRVPSTSSPISSVGPSLIVVSTHSGNHEPNGFSASSFIERYIS